MSKRVLILLGIGFVLIIAGILLLKYELSPAAVESDLEAESIEYDSDLHKDPNQSDNSDLTTVSDKKKPVTKTAKSETSKTETDGTEST